MPVLFITEYSRLGQDFLGHQLDSASVPAIAEQRVEFSHEQGLSDPFLGATRFVEVISPDDCCLAFGAKPQADPTKHWLPAGILRRYGVSPGHLLAVVLSEDAG